MGDGDDGVESFEIDDLDLQYALDPDSRSRRRPTKNQQIYGIWAEAEESDEETSRYGGKKKKANYSGGVSFVSGGQQGGTREEGADKPETEQARSSKDDQTKKKWRGRERGTQELAGMRGMTGLTGASATSSGADWARHSKGDVLMRMMQGMGYVPGQGLGANKQGIVEPIQAAVRPGRAAVGAYGKEAQGPKFGESAADAQKRERDELDGEGDVGEAPVPVRGMWKKSRVVTPRTRYKTVDEVLEEGGILKKRLDVSSNSSKVIDMTGREQKVYSGYDAFASKTRTGEDEELPMDRLVFDIPELRHNVRTLVDLTEEEIVRADRQLRSLREQNHALAQQLQQVRQSTSEERRQRERTVELLAVLADFAEMGEPDLASCERLFHKLRTQFYDEYRLFELQSIAASTVIPLMKKLFAIWDPLASEQSDYGVEMIETWKAILDADEKPFFVDRVSHLDRMPSYDRLLWEAWMPSIRKCALHWNPRDSGDTMVHVLETWLPLLPPWLRDHLLDHVIIARIQQQVDTWNPLTDTVPIHIWLHPWLPILGDRLMPVYAPIRQKLARALQKWHPPDKSAKSVLKPWKDVFAAGTMQSFLMQNIVPKLEQCLAKMVIDPSTNQRLEEWDAVMHWLDLINPQIIAQILDRAFFPKWYEALCFWLDAPGAIHREVASWYKEWSLRIPDSVRELQSVRDQLTRATHAMDEARRGFKVTRHLEPSRGMPVPPPPPPSTTNALSFKEMLESRAHAQGIVFVPQPNKFREGHQVFWFGNISIYMDRCVLFGYDVLSAQWSPISLDHLESIC